MEDVGCRMQGKRDSAFSLAPYIPHPASCILEMEKSLNVNLQ
jgi:hypothetical protein